MKWIKTVTSKGQITLPAAMMRQLGLRPGDKIRLHVTGSPKNPVLAVTRAVIPPAAEKLQREKLLRATRQALKLPPVDDVAEWQTAESTSQWVRHLRRKSDRKRSV